MPVIYCLMSILIGTLSKKNKKNREKSGLKTGRFAASVYRLFFFAVAPLTVDRNRNVLQKGGVPAAPSGTATLLRLSPSYQFYPRPLLNGYGLQVPPASMA